MKIAHWILLAFLLIAVLIFLRTSNDRAGGRPEPINTVPLEDTTNTSTNDSVSSANIAPGTYSSSITHQGIERTFTLHIPTGYTTQETWPLVLLLHGGTGGGTQILSSTELAAAADRQGYIVVAPDGVDGHWNDGNERNTRVQVDHIDDVDFIDTLLANLTTRYSIDTDRIYSTGISNGGAMTQRLACELPGRFAAIAPVSSPMSDGLVALCDAATPIPVLGIQGSEDPFQPIHDDDGLPELPRLLQRMNVEQKPLHEEDVTAFWSQVNQCTNAPTVRDLPQTVNDGTQAVSHTFDNCQTDKPVLYYFVYGMGHSWPGGAGAANLENISGPSTGNLNANDVILDFFSQHAL